MQVKPAARQAGITLIESLIALVLAALGILGVLGMQMRTLADTQTGVRRAQAIRLIEDLSERTRVNPNSLGQIATYVSDWGSTAQATTDCTAAQCTSAELASFHLARWRTSVGQVLPGGSAKIFIAEDEATSSDTDGNRRQLGVMLRWRENEKSAASDYQQPIGLDSDGSRGKASETATCSTGYTCHLQYIPLSARCAPYFADSTVQFFCSGQ